MARPNRERIALQKQIFSKEVLAEPMKQLAQMYPPYIAEHSDELSETDKSNYKKQYTIVKKLVKQFDLPGDDFDKVAELMQEMNECGQPPKEIMEKLSPDAAGAMAGMDPSQLGDQCSIM